MKKQDRTYVRTASDLEMKYNIGGTDKKVKKQSEDIRVLNQLFTQFEARINTRMKKVEEQLSVYGYYPVGSLHISVDATNPSELFGGVWELYTEGHFVVGLEQENEDAPNELLQALDKCYVWQRIE